MDIDVWPIVGRARLVQTFRPGESPLREAPFRTLRRHRWSTVGVKVVTRNADRASGRFTIFSVLNVEAARCAREGRGTRAVALAKAASRVERGEAFSRLKALLSGRPAKEVSAAVDGDVSERKWSELHDVLRLVARETRAVRARNQDPRDIRAVIAGAISEAQPEFLVLEAGPDLQTYVPRWLAHSAGRERVGDLLALVTDKLDDNQMVVSAVPAIGTGVTTPTFTPFGRAAPVGGLTAADARLRSHEPAPLRVLVPITIER